MRHLWLGTLVGAVIGGWLLGWSGAVLGALLGHMLDRHRQRDLQQEPCDRCARARFLGHLTASHPVSDLKALWVDWLDQQPAPSAAVLEEAFQRGRMHGALAEQSRAAEQSEWAEQTLRDGWNWLTVLEPQARLMRSEWLNWGRRWGWTDEQLATFRQSKAIVPFPQYLRALQVLQLTEADSDTRVRQRYRQLMNKHHPDKIAHEGSAIELDRAQQSCIEFQAAYRCIQQYRSV